MSYRSDPPQQAPNEPAIPRLPKPAQAQPAPPAEPKPPETKPARKKEFRAAYFIDRLEARQRVAQDLTCEEWADRLRRKLPKLFADVAATSFTLTVPGSAAKIEIMTRRAERGHRTDHELDFILDPTEEAVRRSLRPADGHTAVRGRT